MWVAVIVLVLGAKRNSCPFFSLPVFIDICPKKGKAKTNCFDRQTMIRGHS